MLLLTLIVGGINGGNDNNDHYDPDGGDHRRKGRRHQAAEEPSRGHKRRLKRPHRDDREDEPPEGEQCVHLNRKTTERCPYDGFAELLCYCVNHFKTSVMEPLRTPATMERFHRAKEALQRHFRRIRRARNEELDRQQAELLQERGLDQECLTFADELSESSGAETDLPTTPVSSLLPSRNDMEVDCVQEEEEEDLEEEEDEIRIIDDEAVASAQKPQRVRATVRAHHSDPRSRPHVVAVATAASPMIGHRHQPPPHASAPARSYAVFPFLPPSPSTPASSGLALPGMPPAPCFTCHCPTAVTLANSCPQCTEIFCQDCQRPHSVAHHPTALQSPQQPRQLPTQPLVEILSSSEEEAPVRLHKSHGMIGLATASLDGLRLQPTAVSAPLSSLRSSSTVLVPTGGNAVAVAHLQSPPLQLVGQGSSDTTPAIRVEVMSSSDEQYCSDSTTVNCCECLNPANQVDASQCEQCSQIVHHFAECIGKHPHKVF